MIPFANYAVLLSLALMIGGQDEPPSNRFVTSQIERRVVKRFDFHEPDNFSTTPKNWMRIDRPDYPRSNEVGFDLDVYFSAPASFRLAFRVGSVGAWYRAKDIDVYPSSDYRITARVRAAGVDHARAYITAFFLDHAFRRIAASEVSSTPFRGAGGDAAWSTVTLDLPGGFENTRWIGLTCRVQQPPPVELSAAGSRPIRSTDVNGVAWFDDIVVSRLPRLELMVTAAGAACGGSVFGANESTVIRATIADPLGADLRAEVMVLDAEGATVETHAAPIDGSDATQLDIDVCHLPAGRYTARAVVKAGGAELLRKERPFLRLAGATARPADSDGGFGIVLDATTWSQPATARRMLAKLGPDLVKIPLWRRGSRDDEIVWGSAAARTIRDTVRKSGISVIGTLVAPPASIAGKDAPAGSGIVDVLASEPTRWSPYLSLIAARYGPFISAWQIGGDGMDAAAHPSLSAAVDNVRAVLQTLITAPKIAVSSQSGRAPPAASGTPIWSVDIPVHVSSNRIPELLEPLAQAGRGPLWATVHALPHDRYRRGMRLAEFVRRLVTARAAGADAVFLPQPWQLDPSDPQVVIPHEEFAILHGMTQLLRGLSEVESVWLDEGVSAYLFSDAAGERGALVLWIDGDGSAQQTVHAPIQPDARIHTPWGARRDDVLQGEGGSIPVATMPSVVMPVEPWRIRLQARFAATPTAVSPVLDRQPRTLTLTNTRRTKLRGEIRFDPPPGWRIEPRHMPVDLEAGQTLEMPLTFRLPRNYPNGRQTLHARLTIDGRPATTILLRTPVAVESGGLDVAVLPHIEDGEVHITQRITNRTDRDMRLRAYIVAPNRARDTRLIAGLEPGQTAVREFRVPDAENLRGEAVRVSVEQLDGPAVHNHVIRFD